MSNETTHIWEKTNNFRFHRLITSYSWSTGWDSNYKQTLQQMHKCSLTGQEKWEPIEVITEEIPNCPRYG